MAKKYWIKLEKDFLNSSQIKVIKNMHNGKDYVIFYLALMLESVSTDGYLRFTELVPYNEEMLASITETNIDIVRSAMKLFQSLGLIELLSDGTMFMTEVPIRISKESDSADRVRIYRQTKKALGLLEEKPKPTEEELLQDFIRDVVIYLNQKTGKTFKYTSEHTKRFITARKRNGFVLEDFKKVIDIKTAQWQNDPKMNMYLRPDTLFGAKFESYLNEKFVENKDNKGFQERHYTDDELSKMYDNLDDIVI